MKNAETLMPMGASVPTRRAVRVEPVRSDIVPTTMGPTMPPARKSMVSSAAATEISRCEMRGISKGSATTSGMYPQAMPKPIMSVSSTQTFVV